MTLSDLEISCCLRLGLNVGSKVYSLKTRVRLRGPVRRSFQCWNKEIGIGIYNWEAEEAWGEIRGGSKVRAMPLFSWFGMDGVKGEA